MTGLQVDLKCVKEREVRLETKEEDWGCFFCTMHSTWRQYKHDTPTGWGNSSCMITNQTWNVYVVCVWLVWVCEFACSGKNMRHGWLWSACGASHCFIYSCITVWQGGWLPSPDQRYGYWTGQDINISPAPFLLFFFSPSLLSFDMVLAFPRAVAHSQCAGGSATSWRHSQVAMEDRAKWAEERYLCERKCAAFMW